MAQAKSRRSKTQRGEMKMKKAMTTLLALCLTAGLTLPAGALEYRIDAPDGPELGRPTSVETVITADGGARKNEDVSKNAALIPPEFGTPSADARNTGGYLTPNLAPGVMAADGAVINGGSGAWVFPDGAWTIVNPGTSGGSMGYTGVTEDLYYANGSLGTLKIPAIGLTVKVYQGTGSSVLKKGAGHFEETSIWDGNVALASHNRGSSDHFADIHTLEVGDRITLTTKLGTRTYKVTSVSKVSETDRSGLTETVEDCITLYTCVRDQSAYRWCVRGEAV